MSANQTGQNKVLCLSGGGVKGIAELVVLQKIEEITQQPISKLFNIISGTSVGGLIAALLTIPKEEGSTEPRYSAKEALELFENTAPEIFPKSLLNWGLIKHKYSQKPLEKMLEKHLGDDRLNDSLCRLIIPVADLNEGRNGIKIFDSDDKHSIHIRIKDVLLATTAAPTYFKAVVNNEAVKDYDYAAGKPYAFADGGLGANRPAAMVLQVLKEGHTYHEQADIMERTTICSINFGIDDQIKAKIPSANFDGILGWLLNGLVDMLMKNDEEADATEVRLDLTGEGQNTEIVLPITKECKNLDDSSKSNIARLKVIAEQYLANNSKLVQDLCDRLMVDYQDNLKKPEVLNSDLNTNAMVGDEINDEGYESDDNLDVGIEVAVVEPKISAIVSANDEGYESDDNLDAGIEVAVVEPKVSAIVIANDEGYESDDNLDVGIEVAVVELKVSAIVIANDEGYESDDNLDVGIEVAVVEPKVSAIVSDKLESANTIANINKEIDTTVIDAKLTTIQEAIQWIVSDIQNHENASEYFQYLEYLEHVNYHTVELDFAEIKSLPDAVQKTVQWIVSLDAENRPAVLNGIKSLITVSHEDTYTTSCAQDMELEGQEPMYEHTLVDCAS